MLVNSAYTKNDKIYLYKHLVQLSLLLFMALSLVACSEESEPLEQISIRLALPMQPSSSLVMIALDRGYFDNNGLAVEVTEFPSGKRALQESFLSGKSDVAISADVPVIKAILAKHKFKIIASVFNANNVNRIIARRDSAIVQPADLKGKRVATQYASAVHFFLHLFLLEHALSEEDVESSYFKAEQLPERLARGEIDAFSMREPYISQAKAKLGENYIVFSAQGLYQQMDLVVISDALITQKADAAKRIIKALIQAEKYAKNHPQQALDIISKKLGIDSYSLRQSWSENDMNITLHQSMLLLMEDIARWSISSGLVDQQELPNFLDLILITPLESVSPQAATIIR